LNILVKIFVKELCYDFSTDGIPKSDSGHVKELNVLLGDF